MVTASDFVKQIKIPLSERWGYIYGFFGRVWTEKLQATYSQPGHKNYEMTARYGAKWIGKKVCDCSGLLRWALMQLGESIVHQARYQYTDASAKKGKLIAGRKEDGSLPLPGTAVFLKGNQDHIHHVGVYVGNDTVIEAKGTVYGVTTSHLAHWDHWGELKVVDYSDAGALESDTIETDATDSDAGSVIYATATNPNRLLNVRSGPGSSYLVKYQIEKGTQVEVLDAGEPEWWMIRYQGKTGYTYAKYLTVTPKEITQTDHDEPKTFTVTIRGLDASTATYLLECYPGATSSEDN